MEVIYREVAQTFITKLSPCNYRLRGGFVIHASNPTSNSGQNSRSFMLSSSAYSPHSFQRFRSVNRHDSTFKIYADVHPSPPSARCPVRAPLQLMEPLSSTELSRICSAHCKASGNGSSCFHIEFRGRNPAFQLQPPRGTPWSKLPASFPPAIKITSLTAPSRNQEGQAGLHPTCSSPCPANPRHLLSTHHQQLPPE